MKTIGIDVGGTNITAISFEPKKGIVYSTSVSTPKTMVKFLEALKAVILECMDKDVKGIGLGLPGTFDVRKRSLASARNIPFMEGFDFVSFLNKYSKNVVLDNDVKCVARAELAFGAAKGASDCFLIALGTGIGSCVIIDGKIYYGTGSAGEIGRMLLEPGKDFEALAAGRTLKKFNSVEFSRVGKYLGQALANVVYLLSPSIIVVTGGVAAKAPKVLVLAKKELAKHLHKKQAQALKVVPGSLYPFAGAIGAAMMAVK